MSTTKLKIVFIIFHTVWLIAKQPKAQVKPKTGPYICNKKYRRYFHTKIPCTQIYLGLLFSNLLKLLLEHNALLKQPYDPMINKQC